MIDTNLVSQIAAASPDVSMLHQVLQLGPLGLYLVLGWFHARLKRLETSLGRIENHLGTMHFKRR